MLNRAHIWTDAQDKLLRRLHADGLSFSTIADRINAETGSAFSKNSCVGRCFRQGIERRSRITAGMKTGGARVLASRMAARAKQAQAAPVHTPGPVGGIGILELTPTTCRFMLGAFHEISTRYCGAQVQNGSVYCCNHHQRCYSKTLQLDRRSPGEIKPPRPLDQFTGQQSP